MGKKKGATVAGGLGQSLIRDRFRGTRSYGNQGERQLVRDEGRTGTVLSLLLSFSLFLSFSPHTITYTHMYIRTRVCYSHSHLSLSLYHTHTHTHIQSFL
jgi:hypothetical protein